MTSSYRWGRFFKMDSVADDDTEVINLKIHGLLKSIFILYLICLSCYIPFTRQPDYFDGEKSPAIIQFKKDSVSGITIPTAVYHDGLKEHNIDARYVFREWKNGDKLKVIYESANPEKAAVYSIWGYWFSWGELLASIILYFVLFRIAIAVTRNPTPDALIEQMEFKEEKKKKYKE